MVNIKSIVESIIKSIIVGTLLASTLVMYSEAVSAKTISIKSAVKYKPVTLTINGVKQGKGSGGIIKDGKVLIPVKFTFERLNSKVYDFTKIDRTIYVSQSNGKTFRLVLNSSKVIEYGSNDEYTTNERVSKLPAITQKINGIHFMSYTAVSKLLGVKVEIDAKANNVIITTKKVVHGVVVNHGTHGYGSFTQKEYDKILTIVNQEIRENEKVKFENLDFPFSKYFVEYLNGERWDGNPASIDQDEKQTALYKADQFYGELIKADFKKEEIMRTYRAIIISRNLIHNVKIPKSKEKTLSSTYDLLINGNNKNNYFGTMLLYNAVFDCMGLNNAIVLDGSGFAYLIIEINGNWVQTDFNIFLQMNLSFLKNEPNSMVLVQPTNGYIINKDGTITKKK